LSAINLKNHPYLLRLLEPGETIEDLLKLSPEQILLRWFNYHLREAGSNRRVQNFTSDIKVSPPSPIFTFFQDSEAYTVLLHQLDKKQCDRRALNEGDPLKRAELVLQNADKIGCRKFLHPKGNQRFL
jgi:plastin-1